MKRSATLPLHTHTHKLHKHTHNTHTLTHNTHNTHNNILHHIKNIVLHLPTRLQHTHTHYTHTFQHRHTHTHKMHTIIHPLTHIHPKATIILFKHGQANITGIHTLTHAIKAEIYRAKFTRDQIHPPSTIHHNIVNITAHYTLNTHITLTRLTTLLLPHTSITYDPQIFPAAQIKFTHNNLHIHPHTNTNTLHSTTALLYHNGQTIITGAQNLTHVHNTLTLLLDLIEAQKVRQKNRPLVNS